jgi:hypothetical protein
MIVGREHYLTHLVSTYPRLKEIILNYKKAFF